MATTIIQKIQRTDDGRFTIITGTVGGTSHTFNWKDAAFMQFASINLNITPQQLAQKFADHFNVRAAIVSALTALSVTLAPPTQAQSVTVVFDGSTPLTEIGPDFEEVKSAVGGTTTYMLVKKEWLFELYNGSLNANAAVSLGIELAKQALGQATRDVAANTTGNVYIASFTTT